MEERFKKLAAQYWTVAAEDMKDDMRFREDMGFSSLDLMTFLGDLEDEFDVELSLEQNADKLAQLQTVGGAIAYLKEKMEVQ